MHGPLIVLILIWLWWHLPLFPLIPSKKLFLTRKIPLEIDNAASTGIHERYMKYGQLPFASSGSSTNTV